MLFQKWMIALLLHLALLAVAVGDRVTRGLDRTQRPLAEFVVTDRE
jgi:hypothetical protein